MQDSQDFINIQNLGHHFSILIDPNFNRNFQYNFLNKQKKRKTTKLHLKERNYNSYNPFW